MNPELNAEDIGSELGIESVGSVVKKVEEYCAYEEQRIALANEPRILALRAEIALLQEEDRNLEERLRQAPPPGDLRSRRRKAVYYWTVTILLAVAAFVFSLLAFDPYRLGWKSYLYCLGIAIVTPFLVEEVMERLHADKLVKTLATAACVAAIASLVFLAVIRGDLLAEETQTAESSVVIDGAEPTPPAETTFYAHTLTILRFAMAFLAIAMELGAGLALHRAWRITAASGEDWKALHDELRGIRERMVALLGEMAALQNEPAIFVARFWRNFYRAMLTHTVRNAMTKLLLILVLVALPFLHGQAAAEQVTIIAALDLTRSVAGAGPDQQSDFQKNIEGVTTLLTQVPASARVVVLGITDRSFAQPYLLLSATVPNDSGYFGERLKAARSELVRIWKRRSANLTPQFRYTDILGAILVANQMFDESPSASRRMLIIFSDMRHHTPDLDLESGGSVPRFGVLRKQAKIVSVPTLQGVAVYVLGADGAGKSVGHWQSLKIFWAEYFQNAGATLVRYSVLRELPALVKEPTESKQH